MSCSSPARPAASAHWPPRSPAIWAPRKSSAARAAGSNRITWSARSGIDAAFDYHQDPVAALKELAPEGITVFFDTVGGPLYEAALEAAAPGARFALCGSLSTQLGAAAQRFPEPDQAVAAAKGIELLPFSCHHTPNQVAAWHTHFRAWLEQDTFVFPQTIVQTGIDAVPDAFLSLLRGDYRGNVSVGVSEGCRTACPR
jgi:NADPH-dependent curcumin reductase CurA